MLGKGHGGLYKAPTKEERTRQVVGQVNILAKINIFFSFSGLC